MAIRCSPHPCFIISKGHNNMPVKRISMLHKSQLQHRSTNHIIMSCMVNKVFEDQSKGIVCYRDESGEMICEGYDEGPRFHQTAAPASDCHQREIWILDQLQQRRIRVVESVDHHCIKNGVAVPDHHD
ncbi:hypothetical protein QJS10_CPB19g01986 [Acorus calamus]|uniref:Uncharacterized protein n=1 Tax=Acorus calamus TaxID=4465 RepID=A0AAV9CDB7_ACOCL|nr:hypothetical protein QJS10_CPB19g01986 [Acorus calamus]